MSVYILSYIHHKDNWVDMQYGNLMLPVISLFLSIFSPLSGPLENTFGPIVSLFISSIIIEICLILYYFQRNIWFFYGITLLTGIGSGLSSNIPIKNVCFYYPEKKGLINAIILSFTGICESLFILLGEKIINPNKEGVIDEKTEPYYSEEVSERSKYYFLFSMSVLPVGTILSFIFFYKYDPSFEKEEKEEEKSDECEEKEENEENEKNQVVEEKEELRDIFIKKTSNQKKLNSFYKASPSKNIKIALKSFRFWRNIIIASVMPFWILFLTASYRAYVVMLGVDTNIIFYLGTALGIISCILGIVWAALYDKFGFQPLMKIIGFICTSMSIYFYFFMDNKTLYVIGLIIIYCSVVGIGASLTPHIMQIYGMRYFLTIGGFTKLFNQMSIFSSAMISVILSMFFKNAEELVFPYKMVIVGGGILSVIGFILAFFENDEKFIYGDENEESKYYVKENEDKPNNSLEKEKNYINENASSILDVTNPDRSTVNTNEIRKKENNESDENEKNEEIEKNEIDE